MAVLIIPYAIAILFTIGMFRASCAMDILVDLLQAVVGLIGIPAEVVPMAILRPLTGPGSVGIILNMTNQFKESSRSAAEFVSVAIPQ